jgi:hypothetical protein
MGLKMEVRSLLPDQTNTDPRQVLRYETEFQARGFFISAFCLF